MQTEEVSLCEIFYQKNEISQVLPVSISQLTTYLPKTTSELISTTGRSRKSPFFQAQRLYFYFYDGRYQRTKDGVIDIYEKKGEPGKYEATLTICSVSANGSSSEIFYTGRVLYSDMLIRFSFVNQYNPLEEDLMYIFNLWNFEISQWDSCAVSPVQTLCLVHLNA